MNIHHVRTFCAIVEEGSFSRAGERLHLTQPTVSAQVQGLEKTLRTRLFERSAQGISLTEAGRVFHSYALQILELCERATQAMDELQHLATGRVRVGASTVPGHYLLPRALAEFKQRHPGVEVSLEVSNSQEVRAGVREGQFELGMLGEKVRDERLAYEPLVRDHLVVVMRAQHPLSGRESLQPEELAQHPIITREQGSATRSTFERALRGSGVSPDDLQVFLELGSAEAIKAAVRETDALAVLSEWSVKDEERLGLVRTARLERVDLDRELYLVRRAHGYLSVASEAFVRFLRREFLGETDGAAS